MRLFALIRRYLGPVLIVAGGFLLAIAIIATGPRPDREARPPDAPPGSDRRGDQEDRATHRNRARNRRPQDRERPGRRSGGTGQFVSRGESVATLYSTDYAEVRLPVKDQDLAFLPFSLARTEAPRETMAKATLRAEFAGGMHAWEADVVRTEGELDPLSRVVNVVAQVADPYEPEGGAPPHGSGSARFS